MRKYCSTYRKFKREKTEETRDNTRATHQGVWSFVRQTINCIENAKYDPGAGFQIIKNVNSKGR